MRWLLPLFLLVLLGACDEKPQCSHVTLDDYTKQEIKALAEFCGTEKPTPKPHKAAPTLTDQIAIGAQQMHMSPDQFVQTDYGKALVWDAMTQRLLLVVSIAIIWIALLILSLMVLRVPKTADWHKGRFFTRMRVREWQDVRRGENGDHGGIIWMVFIAAVLTIGLYLAGT
jgi:hypothetical protein